MQKKLFILITFLVCRSLLPAQGNWTTIGRMLLPVSGAEAVAYDSSMVILGGYSDSLFRRVKTIQEFLPPSSWRIAGSMRYARDGFVSGRDSAQMFLFGGMSPRGSVDSNATLEKIRNIIPMVSSVVDTEYNFARIASTGLIHNGLFYFFGGRIIPRFGRDSTTPFIVEYDLRGHQITYQSDTLYNQWQPEGMMSASIDSVIFLFGGSYNGVSRSISKYNMITHRFERLRTNLLRPRAYGRAVRLGTTNKIMIVGGINENSFALRTMEIFEVLPNGAYTISQGPNFLYARKNLMAVYFREEVYIMGGEDMSHNDVVPFVEKFSFTNAINEPPENEIPTFLLHQNYPNPFNPVTTIGFSLAAVSNVTLNVYDILGKEVATLIHSRLMDKGTHEVEFDAGNLESGIYFSRLAVGKKTQIQKMLLLK